MVTKNYANHFGFMYIINKTGKGHGFPHAFVYGLIVK
jgi:hypothetical protein